MVCRLCACTSQWTDAWLPCCGTVNVQQGARLTPSAPAHSFYFSCGLLIAERSKKGGGCGVSAQQGLGRFFTSSGWAEACTQLGSKIILEPQRVAKVVLEADTLRDAFSFPVER